MTATESPRLTPPVLMAEPMPAITPHPIRPAAKGLADWIDFDRLQRVDEGELAERADAEGRRQGRAVGQGHFLLGVAAGEAVPGAAALAGPAVAARGAPGQDHEVAGLDVGYAIADLFDNSCGFMAQQERELVVDGTFAVVKVGVANAAGLNAYECLAFAGVRYVDGYEFDGRAFGPRYYSLNFVDRH